MAQYFNLTLDTTAPSNGILSGLNSYYNSTATVTISADSAAFMKVWTNQTAVGTTSDSQVPSSWEPYDTSKTVSFTGQGTQYVHAMFMDSVGNIGPVVNSAATIYDTVAPIISAVSINSGDGYTRVVSNTFRVTFSDATSGVTLITLGGDIKASEKQSYNVTAEDRAAGYKDFTVTLQGADGIKTVGATATDFAGNTCAITEDTIVLDTTAAAGTLVLRKADDSANLPAFINYRDYAAAIETTDTDIVSYKIWEGANEPSDWTSVTQDPEEPRILIENLSLSNGDGGKSISAKIQDIAGNVTSLGPVSVSLKTSLPVVSITPDVTVISAVSGFDTVTFTPLVADAYNTGHTTFPAQHSYELKLGTTTIKSGSTVSASIAVTAAEIEAISAGQGAKSFTLEVTDVAENTGTSSAVVITLDKTAPTGSVSASSYYASSSISVTVSGSDTGGAVLSYMKVYLDNNSADWEAYAAGSYQFTSVAEGAHTAHVKFKDSVGNESSVYDSAQFIVDTTAPTGTITTAAYTNNRTISITISASDAKSGIETSGVGYMKVWEDGQTEPSEWESYVASKSITLVEGNDGVRTIKAKFKDNAGNISEILSCTTTLDLDEPDAVLNLLKTDDNGLPARVNYRNFKARISHTAPDTAPIIEYKLYGDFDQSSSSWQTFEYDSNQTYMTISNLTLTTGDALKTITVVLKDAAGNVSSAVNATVTYDTTPPVIDITTAPDYNIVSKTHTLRLNPSTGATITGKYNDMCTFTWSANEALATFKVCVNQPNQTAAAAVAIGTEHGSQNMSGGATEANTNVTSVIFGADFAAVEAVNDTDGAYEIIVYGQDVGGTWSAIHVIEDEENPNPSSQPFTDANGDTFVLNNGDVFNVLSE